VFEAKSYNDVRATIAAGNGIFAAAFLIFSYLFILTPAHQKAFETLLSGLKLNPLIGPFITLTILGGIWGYLTTFMVSLHDRLYEPYLVSWRAGYDADFILRSLCFPYSARVSPRLFEVAFTDKRLRASFMQRLFYRFVGDSKAPHEELRVRFYTIIRDYWLLVLLEIYCVAFFIAVALYCVWQAPSKPPYIALLVLVIASLCLRFLSNRYLPRIRPISAEQINAIHLEHTVDFEKALDAIVAEFHMQP
jgi:hypothetical protein